MRAQSLYQASAIAMTANVCKNMIAAEMDVGLLEIGRLQMAPTSANRACCGTIRSIWNSERQIRILCWLKQRYAQFSRTNHPTN